MKMNKMSLKSTVVVLLVCIGFSCNHNTKISDSDNNITDQRVDSLLSKMTLKEKVGQMTQINLIVNSLPRDLLEFVFFLAVGFTAGSVGII